MKRPTEELLDDLMDDSVPAEFRAVLLDKTLRQARRRKHMRRLKVTAGMIALAVIITFPFWRTEKRATTANRVQEPELTVVSSMPLNSNQLVSTKSNLVPVITSSDVNLALIETPVSVRLYKEINDQQLLALAGDKPVALVRQGPKRAELFFLNSKDQMELLVR